MRIRVAGSEVDNDQLRVIIKADPPKIKGDHSVVVRHLKQIGKVKKLEEWEPCDLTENQKYHCSEVLFSLILCSNKPFLDHTGTNNKRWILYN